MVKAHEGIGFGIMGAKPACDPESPVTTAPITCRMVEAVPDGAGKPNHNIYQLLNGGLLDSRVRTRMHTMRTQEAGEVSC